MLVRFFCHRLSPVLTVSFAVADICVMLALMAGRNVRETMHIVDEGKVCK